MSPKTKKFIKENWWKVIIGMGIITGEAYITVKMNQINSLTNTNGEILKELTSAIIVASK